MPRSPSIKTPRPKPQAINSFPGVEPIKDRNEESRVRSNTVNNSSITVVPDAKQLVLSPDDGAGRHGSDVFVSTLSADAVVVNSSSLASHMHTLEQLPIEIRSFTERFLKSLSVKSHATPLRIDAISELFQDFYIQADSHISTHIAALTTRLSRDNSPASSTFTRRTVSAKASQDSLADQQMLTALEIADKRKARRRLELQRIALEEAVERSVCDKVYDKIYRHRSTDDEEKDAKLRSKTAALSLVGVGLEELHINIPEQKDTEHGESEARIFQQLAPAREHLQRMDEARYPLGKLQHLTAAHQSIVETLAKVLPSTSSADEVLPMLIYTLVTSSPETLNVASNLHFIQLFRANAKIDGEAAYCLVNLEAAISFLETVDLSSLRANDATQRAAPHLKIDDHNAPETMSLTADLPGVSSPKQTVKNGEPSAALQSPQQTTAVQHRKISQMLQSQAERIEAGKETLLHSADNAFDSINSTLENSFKFLFGRLREQEAESERAEVIIPKTLDDARRLVNSPILEDIEAQGGPSQTSVAGILADEPLSRPTDTVLGLVAGKRPSREMSAESVRSGSAVDRPAPVASVAESKSTTSGPAEAVGNFVNAINPLSRFAVGVPSFARFGRSPGGPLLSGSPAEKSPVATALREDMRRSGNNGPNDETNLNELEGLAQLRRAKSPLQKFVKLQDPLELRLGDVAELLVDYQRLAGLVMNARSM